MSAHSFNAGMAGVAGHEAVDGIARHIYGKCGGNTFLGCRLLRVLHPWLMSGAREISLGVTNRFLESDWFRGLVARPWQGNDTDGMCEVFRLFLDLGYWFPAPITFEGIIGDPGVPFLRKSAFGLNEETDRRLRGEFNENRVPEFFMQLHHALGDNPLNAGSRESLNGIFRHFLNAGKEQTPLLILLCKILLLLSSRYGIPFGRFLKSMRIGLVEKNVAPQTMILAFYDFMVDERYGKEAVALLLPLIDACVSTLMPARGRYIMGVIGNLKRFILVSGTTCERYLRIILEKSVRDFDLDISRWVEEGAVSVRTCGEDSLVARTYFDMISETSMKIWAEIDPRVSFDQVAERAGFFANAITERKMELRVCPTNLNQGSSFDAEFATDGDTIFVPEAVSPTRDRRGNILFFMHGVAHECAHIEFGSFLCDENRFAEVSDALEAIFPGQYAKQQETIVAEMQNLVKEAKERGYRVAFPYSWAQNASPLTRLIHHTPWPNLMRDLWNIVEDYRVNQRLYEGYPGFGRERPLVDAIDYSKTVDIGGLPIFWNLLVAFMQLVLYGKIKGKVSPANQFCLEEMMAIFQEFRSLPAPDVYDTCLTAGRLCECLAPHVWKANWSNASSPLRLRAVLGNGSRNGDTDVEQEHFWELLKETPEYQICELERAAFNSSKGSRERGDRYFWTNVPELEKRGSFKYPEWDHERGRYLRNRCGLHEEKEHILCQEEPDDLLTLLRGILPEVRQVFQRLRPRGLVRETGLEDGDDIDEDLHFDALMSLVSGNQMESNFFTQRRRKERSVVAGLILDQSPSTKEEFQGSTIYRHEKAAAYCLAEALSQVGDPFGLFTLFDHGPSVSCFSVLKEFDQPFSQAVKGKLACSGIPERGYSRFAVGLRHLIAKMKTREEKTKIIFFISDGVPVYYEGTDGKTYRCTSYWNDSTLIESATPVNCTGMILKDEAYLLEDLKKVRLEATMAGIKLFCITLDETAGKMMASIFGKFAIHLPRVADLPRRLVEIFRRVTM